MMKNIYKHIFPLLIIILLLTSCTKVVDINVPNGGARLVVEASINWEKGTTGQNQTIKLSTSTAYFDANTNAPVIGANVKVFNNNDGTEFTFQDQGNGAYLVNNFIPQLNQSYSLEIIYEGKTYSATETLMPVVNISQVEQTIGEGTGSDKSTKVTVYFDDPANEINYYLGEFIPSFNPLLTLNPLNDSFTNGSQNFLEFENENFVVGSTLGISLYGISEQYYNFINLLVSQSDGGGSPFQTTPAQLKGNCKNLADLNEEVLGYFRLSEVVKVNYTIK